MTENNTFSFKNARTVFNRELANYFNTPIGYIFLGIFVILMNFLVFFIANYWERGRQVYDFFDFLRITYLFFIPAITMRLWAEEKKSGTIELLFTLPLTETEIIIGKFLSALAFLGIALATTIFLPVTGWYAASPDLMMVIGGYLGAMLMGAAYIALGLYISWLTRDQIVAFLATMAATFFLFLLGYPPVLQFLGPFKELLGFLSVSWHFDSLFRGLLDTRDFVYFASFIALFLYLNKRSIAKHR